MKKTKYEIIKALLRESPYTYEDLAEKIRVTPATLYRWNKGQITPRKNNINNLAKLLGYRAIWKGDEVVIQKETENEFQNIYREMFLLQQQTIIDYHNYIKLLEEKIIRLSKHPIEIEKSTPNFKIISELNINEVLIHSSKLKNIVNHNTVIKGNFSCLGYTIKEVMGFDLIQWMGHYHKDTKKEAVFTFKMLKNSDQNFFKSGGVRLMRSKDGIWKSFNTNFYMTRIDGDKWRIESYWDFISTGST